MYRGCIWNIYQHMARRRLQLVKPTRNAVVFLSGLPKYLRMLFAHHNTVVSFAVNL